MDAKRQSWEDQLHEARRRLRTESMPTRERKQLEDHCGRIQLLLEAAQLGPHDPVIVRSDLKTRVPGRDRTVRPVKQWRNWRDFKAETRRMEAENHARLVRDRQAWRYAKAHRWDLE